MKKICRYVTVLFTAFLLCISLLPPAAWAAEQIDESQPVSLTLEYPVEGIEFRLYKVGSITGSGSLSLEEPFGSYPIDFDQETQSDWTALAVTVDGYITADSIAPLETKTTGEGGTLTFDAQEQGLYLVSWNTHTTGGVIYEAQPFFVTLPTLDEETDSWTYQVTSKVKVAASEDTTDIHVHKAWNDSKNSGNTRPSSIEVTLYCDGEEYETVTLSESTSWDHDWTGLDASKTWTLAEKNVPSGYTVKVTKEGTSFVVTNTYKTPGTTTTPTPTPTPKGNLPYTGTLWWPVPILAALGLMLLLAGLLIRRRGRNK